LRKRSEQWVAESKADLQAFDSGFLDACANAKPNAVLAILPEWCVRRFDFNADRAQSFAPAGIAEYDRVLQLITRQTIRYVKRAAASIDPEKRADLLSAVGLRLEARRLAWVSDITHKKLQQDPPAGAASSDRRAARPLSLRALIPPARRFLI
jgi:hypothetical protein